MITDYELDTMVRGVLADEAARVEQRAPSMDEAVATLLPRVESRAGTQRRLMLVLAAALLLVAALASAIAIGQSLPITVEEVTLPDNPGEFRPVDMLPRGVRPQAIVAHLDGSALVIGERQILRFEPDSGRFSKRGGCRPAGCFRRPCSSTMVVCSSSAAGMM